MRDSIIGLGLALLVIGAWAGLLYTTLVVVNWSVWWPLAPVAMAVQCWLFVGMFILAHDAIHGTLVPHVPALNTAIGTICVALYAGFSYRTLAASHHAHHAHVGTAEDPDFHPEDPTRIWPWYFGFFLHYFGWKQFVLLATASTCLAFLLWERAYLLPIFWGLPVIVSSFQLFYFGTFLPHRHDGTQFEDHHLSHHTELPWLWSLLTCFHFGHHHTHHAQPYLPWWRLPSASKPEVLP